MPNYNPPIRDMQFVLHELFNVVEDLKTIPHHAEIDAETNNAVLEEGGKFAKDIAFPLNMVGDKEGCKLDPVSHEVTAPTGFKQAYAQFVEAGWPALSSDPEYGGQGLPLVVNQCFYEMLNSANQAWTMYPGLTHGAHAALHAHGTPEQKSMYLPKLISGEWTGTMCLTESHCGTDLGLMRTKAQVQADGTYHITGNKIFISAGEHDLAGNIIHLVLARLSDAPPGIKGISLFVVPKYLVNPDGSLGERNGIFCGGLEHKMGINGSATCQMVLENAVGTMVGQPNKGMAAMFVMMNAARLGVGNQSLGLTEVAYQNALAYAKENLGQTNEAMNLYRKMARLDSTYADAFFHIARIYQYDKPQLDSAIFYYKKAIKANQEHIPSYHNLGLVYEEKNDITNALFTYAKVLKMDPDYVLTKERVAVLKNKR